VIATDHAPHPVHTKERPFDEAPPGMLNLETALAVVHTELGATWGLEAMVAAMSTRPAEIAGLTDQGGPIEVGRPANLCVFDPTVTWTVDAADTASLSRNSPWAGRTLTGRVRHTLCAGEAVVVDGSVTR
jgi:dihydroorotase